MAVWLCAVFVRKERDRTNSSSSEILCKNGANCISQNKLRYQKEKRAELAKLESLSKTATSRLEAGGLAYLSNKH